MASFSYASLLQAIDGVGCSSLALCSQVVSQAPQQFRSSKAQASGDLPHMQSFSQTPPAWYTKRLVEWEVQTGV